MEALAHPLLGYWLFENPQHPTLVVIAFETQEGPQLFAATREILEQIAAAFHRQAKRTPQARSN